MMGGSQVMTKALVTLLMSKDDFGNIRQFFESLNQLHNLSSLLVSSSIEKGVDREHSIS